MRSQRATERLRFGGIAMLSRWNSAVREILIFGHAMRSGRELFNLARRIGAIDIGDHAFRRRWCILLIFSLRLIREDRGQNDGFGPYWIVCHNRSPLQYVPTRDRYSICARLKREKRELWEIRAAYRRGGISLRKRARARPRNGREIHTKYTWQTARVYAKEAFDSAREQHVLTTLLEGTREERTCALGLVSGGRLFSVCATRRWRLPIRARTTLKRGFINGKCSRKSLRQTRKTRRRDCRKIWEACQTAAAIFANWAARLCYKIALNLALSTP